MLRRFSGEGGWHDTCASILALTKVDWNNNTLYKTLPVTLVYSQIFADVVKQAPDLVNNIYDYRFFYVVHDLRRNDETAGGGRGLSSLNSTAGRSTLEPSRKQF